MNRKSASWAKSIKQIFSPVRKKRTSARLGLESLDNRIVPATVADAGELRAAITAANSAGLDPITGATQLIQLTAGGDFSVTGFGDNDNLTGDYDIQNKNTAAVPVKTYLFQGLGATPADTVIEGDNLDRIFQIIGAGSIVKFQNLTLTLGQAIDDGTDATPGSVDAKGGAVLNSGGADLFFTSVVMQSNSANGGTGSVLNGATGAPGTSLNVNGQNGGNAKSAYGGGLYSVGGTVTFTGVGTVLSKNFATGGTGGSGGDGSTPAAKGAGGNGGNGGDGGDAAGGAIYLEGGALSISAQAVVGGANASDGNGAIAGSGGSAGSGADAVTLGAGGAGGKGGNGGDASGGAIFVANGSVTIAGGQYKNNFASGGSGGGGSTGTGGNGAGKGAKGGNGSIGGNGGDAFGGAIAVLAGDVTLTGGTIVQTNSATAGSGGNGDNGGNEGTSGFGGNGGTGGTGGSAFGGGIYAGNGTVTLTGALVMDNTASGGAGGFGFTGGTGNIGGRGSNGGRGGDAGGGGVYVVTGKLSLTGATVTGNSAIGGTGATGGNGGAGQAAGGNGGSSGDGGDASGGGAFIGTGDLIVDGGTVSSNSALGGSASGTPSFGSGGSAGATNGVGGNGGAGGKGGFALGGGLYAGDGAVTLTGGMILDDNDARGGDGNSGFFGGSGGTANGAGGNGGNAGDGGKGSGGGVFVQTGSVTVNTGVTVTDNRALGGDAGGNSTSQFGGVGKKGGNGGNGGNGGAAAGGGIGVASGAVTINNGATVDDNTARGGDGGQGDSGGSGANGGTGGNGGNGGIGGLAHGGGIWANDATITISGGVITNNRAEGDTGGNGSVGGNTAAGKAGAGGNGGAGGESEGGGLWLETGAVVINGFAQIDNNIAGSTGDGGAVGGNGASRGTGLGAAANGNGGDGGDARGGGIYVGSASLTISERSLIRFNTAEGEDAGSAATGVTGGARGTGGQGGDGLGGGIFSENGDVSVTTSLVSGNDANGNDGGSGGVTGTGPGKGGDGGLSAGGGIAIVGGTIVLNGAAIGQATSGTGTSIAGTGNSVGLAAGASGGGGAQTGGNGGSSLGGGLYASSAATSVIVLNSSFFFNDAEDAGDGGSGSVADGKGGDSLGGGIYAAAASVTISNSTIAQNQADDPGDGSTVGVGEGGGVYINSKAGAINNSTVVYNFSQDFTGAASLGGGIRNKGTLSLVSNIVGRNNTANGRGTIGDNAANNTLGADVSNGATITGTNNIIENGLGVGLTNGANGNIVGKSFLNPTFNQTGGGSQNTVFVDSTAIGAPQTASNGTQFFRLVTPAEFNAPDVNNALRKLPPNPVTALELGLNTIDPITGKLLATDQIGNARQEGAQVDIGAIEGNGQVNVTSGARVLSAVFSGTLPNTFDKVVVTFSEAMQINTFGPGDVTLLDPNGNPVAIAAVAAQVGSNTVFDVTFAPQGVAGVYSYTQGVDINNVVGGFLMNQNQNNVNGEVPPTSPDDLFRTTATLVVPPGAAGILAVGNVGGTVRILEANDGTQIANVQPLGTGYKGGVSVALADFDGDGTADLAVSAVDPVNVNGLTSDKAGKIFIYDGVDLAKGTLTLDSTITPFATSSSGGAYTNGLNVAAGDVDGDGDVDVIAGSRGQIGSPTGPIGKVEQGRLVVVNVADGSTVGSIITPFGAGYQKGVVVAAGDLDGDGDDEVGVTRGGPVAASLAPAIQTIKLKAFQFAGTGLVELDLAGNGGTSAFAPFSPLDIRRDARVAFVDTDGDGKSQLVFSALDRTTSNTQVRIAAFNVSTTTGLATPVSTGTGPSNSYVVGNNIVDHSISAVAPNGGNLQNLVLVTQSTTSQVQYLDPLTGATATTGFAIALVNGGVNVDGF